MINVIFLDDDIQNIKYLIKGKFFVKILRSQFFII